MSRCAALRGLDNKWFDTQCFSVSNKFKFVCQKDPAELDDCTRYHSPTTQKGGHCVHKNQCPNGYFINGLCGVYNDPDVECCLDTSRRNNYSRIYVNLFVTVASKSKRLFGLVCIVRRALLISSASSGQATRSPCLQIGRSESPRSKH